MNACEFVVSRLESGANKARVITKSADLLKPKIEMSSLVRPCPRYSSAREASVSASAVASAADLSLMAMYEKKNARLDAELNKLKKRLTQAQQMLAQVTQVHRWYTVTLNVVSHFHIGSVLLGT